MNRMWNDGFMNPATLWLGAFGALILYWIVAGTLF